jgi:GR25 family glycosyltransferase involved in LPS biosynthesis
MIVIKDNEASEYYANYCMKSWENYGIDVKKFNAIVPKDLPNLDHIKWHPYSTQIKYTNLNIQAEITDTEKSCFYSHYMIWKICIKKNLPVLVLEHDSYLIHPENLWLDMNYGIIFYDKASTGAYVIFPWYAKIIVEYMKTTMVGCGPYAFLEKCAVENNMINMHVNQKHKKYKAAADQVMSEKYGSTIEHYCTSNPELFDSDRFHKFIKI